jgi:TPR repeat protein
MPRSVAELRTELGKRKLPTDGLKAELEERLQAADEQALKRVKTVMNSMADEWLCPITQELPVDPVMAEDGKFYERWAIEEWLGKQQRSPSTGTAMGTRLTPLTQVRNTIGQLVESGAIEGDKAVAWKKKLEEEKKAKALRAKAEEGDAHAMHHLGICYAFGKYGLRQDRVQARAWYQRAADLHNVPAMAAYGDYLLKGIGGESVPALGLIYCSRAAQAGSNQSAFRLGNVYAKGRHGVPRDTVQAKHWLSQVVDGTCEHKHLKDKALEDAAALLQEISS